MDLFNLRRNFNLDTFYEKDLLPSPIEMLHKWLSQAIEIKALEPSAMTISTVSAEGRPSSRVVLLKELKSEGLVFFTNYESRKGQQIAANKHVAANFIWHELERQVRIEGIAKKLSDEESAAYYKIRPRESQIGAWASPQSKPIPNRQYLDEQLEKFNTHFHDVEIYKPPYWGGYIIVPELFEFWQGRENRLHDRIEYLKQNDEWITRRLAP